MKTLEEILNEKCYGLGIPLTVTPILIEAIEEYTNQIKKEIKMPTEESFISWAVQNTPKSVFNDSIKMLNWMKEQISILNK